MVKSPRINHAKDKKEPLTIDLGTDEVKRMPKEGEPSSEARASSSAASKAGATAAGGDKPKPAEADAKPAGASAKDTPTPSAFGRDAKPGAGPTPPKQDTGPTPQMSPPPVRSTPRRGRAFAGGILGGLIVAALLGGAYFAGFVPPRAGDDSALRAELQAVRDSAAPLQQGITSLTTQLYEMGLVVNQNKDAIAALQQAGAGAAPADIDARLAGFQQRIDGGLAALRERVDALPQQSAAPDIAPLQAEIARIDTAAKEAAAAQQALAGRIDGLERQVAAFSERLAEQAERPGVALAIAASALKAAIDRGTPFMSELETYASIAPDSPDIAALRDMAAAGVPTRAAIEARMPAVATAMIDSGREVDPQAGIMDKLLSSAQSLVSVRPVGMVEGDDVPAIVARMETLLRNGDLAGALAQYDTLPPAAKEAGADLAAQIRARHSADEIVGRALAAALRA